MLSLRFSTMPLKHILNFNLKNRTKSLAWYKIDVRVYQCYTNMQPFKSLPNPIKNQKSPKISERLLRSFCSAFTVSRSTCFGCCSRPRDEASGFFTICLCFNFFIFWNLKSVELRFQDSCMYIPDLYSYFIWDSRYNNHNLVWCNWW